MQVRSVDVKEALRLQKENNFVILDVRPEAEFKEVSFSLFCIVFGFTWTNKREIQKLLVNMMLIKMKLNLIRRYVRYSLLGSICICIRVELLFGLFDTWGVVLENMLDIHCCYNKSNFSDICRLIHQVPLTYKYTGL